jgi:hypothetical protein
VRPPKQPVVAWQETCPGVTRLGHQKKIPLLLTSPHADCFASPEQGILPVQIMAGLMTNFRSKVVMVAVFAGAGATVFSQTTSYDVPLNNPVYRYLDMLPLPGRVDDISLSNRPFTEAQVCSLLVYADRQHICRDIEVNNFYLRQFTRTSESGPERTIPARLSFDGCRIYAYPYVTTSFGAQDSDYTPLGFTALGVDSISKGHEFFNKTGIGGRLYSSIGKAIAYFDGVIVTEYTSRQEWVKTNDPHRGEMWAAIMADTSHLVGFDDFTAYVKFPLLSCDLKLGNDRVSWGYADSSGLLFSGIGRPFLHIKLDKAFGALNYTFLLGKLIGDTYEQKRTVYAKHITYTPRQWLSLGFSDVVISANKEIEPIYFLPFAPFYFSQHYLGAPDNLLMSFDGKLLIGNQWTAYGELLIDDMSNLLGIFRNTTMGDKWGGLFGIKVFNPLPAVYTSAVKLEITQIEPWVYSHPAVMRMEIPVPAVHFGEVLGNDLGPHSREVTLDMTCQFSKKIGGGLTLRQIWKGKGPGSSPFDNYITLYDAAADSIARNILATKAYRFKDFDRNRTVVSARMFAFIYDWLLLNGYGDFALERQPVPVNLFRVGLDVQVNY